MSTNEHAITRDSRANTLESCRLAVQVRLRDDRSRLVVLRTIITHGEGASDSVLQELRCLAWNIRTAAEATEDAALLITVCSVEEALNEEARLRVAGSNRAALDSLGSLIDLLARYDKDGLPFKTGSHDPVHCTG